MHPITTRLAIAALGALLVAGPAAAAQPPAFRCGFAKMRAALVESSALNACFRRAIIAGTDADPACVDAAQAKLQATFDRLDAGGGCSATGDAPSIDRLVDRFSIELARALNGQCVASGDPCADLTPCCSGVCMVTDIDRVPTCQ